MDRFTIGYWKVVLNPNDIPLRQISGEFGSVDVGEKTHVVRPSVGGLLVNVVLYEWWDDWMDDRSECKKIDEVEIGAGGGVGLTRIRSGLGLTHVVTFQGRWEWLGIRNKGVVIRREGIQGGF